MSSLRAIVRVLIFLALSAGALVLWFLLWPVRAVAPSTHAGMHAAFCGVWARTVCRAIGLRAHVEGSAPRRPFVLVTNHMGYLDIVVLMAQAPAVFVSRGDVANWPMQASAGSEISGLDGT